MNTENAVTVAASSDWHIRADADKPRYLKVGEAKELLYEMSRIGDVIVYCGDFTDFDDSTGKEGLKRSAQTAAQIFKESVIPKLAVLGNHDHEGDAHDMVTKILEEEGGVTMIQGESYVLSQNGLSVGFAGAKGLGGGYDKYFLSKYGEKAIRDYRDEIDAENCALENALQGLNSDKIVVVTHYSPIRATILSEGPELFHGLGNSGIEDVIDKFSDRVVLALHGHAHAGDMHGRTKNGVNVDNVAIQVLQKARQGEKKEFIPTNLFTSYSIK